MGDFIKIDMDYDLCKEGIKMCLNSTAKNFVQIGYYLKFVRDNNLCKENGYDTVWDFARSEFGLTKSTTSRFMAVNDKFSAGGNSDRLESRYELFNQSQLIEMLNLPEDIEVTPDTTVAEMRKMKKQLSTAALPDHIEGQLEIADFPQLLPEPVDNVAAKQETEDVLSLQQPVSILLDTKVLATAEPSAGIFALPVFPDTSAPVQLPTEALQADAGAAAAEQHELVATSQLEIIDLEDIEPKKQIERIAITCTEEQFDSIHECLMAIDDYCQLECSACPYWKGNLLVAVM